jgi:hypothetical protein
MPDQFANTRTVDHHDRRFKLREVISNRLCDFINRGTLTEFSIFCLSPTLANPSCDAICDNRSADASKISHQLQTPNSAVICEAFILCHESVM